jgi:hypothetical protein
VDTLGKLRYVSVRCASAAGTGAMLKAGRAEVVSTLFRSMERFHGGGSTIEAGEFAEGC